MADDDKPELGSEEIEPAYYKMMNGVARAVDDVFNGENCEPRNRKTGFVMLVFPYNDQSGRCNYISNGAARDDVMRLLEEQLNRFRLDSDSDDMLLQGMARELAKILGPISSATLLSAAQAAVQFYRRGFGGKVQ